MELFRIVVLILFSTSVAQTFKLRNITHLHSFHLFLSCVEPYLYLKKTTIRLVQHVYCKVEFRLVNVELKMVEKVRGFCVLNHCNSVTVYNMLDLTYVYNKKRGLNYNQFQFQFL